MSNAFCKAFFGLGTNLERQSVRVERDNFLFLSLGNNQKIKSKSNYIPFPDPKGAAAVAKM